MLLLPTPLQLRLARRVQTADDQQFPELHRGVAKLLSGPPLQPPPPPPPQVSPKAAAKRPPPPPPKGGAKGPAPPPRRREPPKWRGPAASKEWKTDRVISWTPIRQASRLEASVWRGVSLSEAAPEVPDGLVDGLNAAFMSKASAEAAPRRPTPFSRQSAPRLLSRRQALQADILHAKLARCGIQNPAQLAWITNAGELPATAQDEQSAARAYVRRRVRLCALRRWRCGTRPLSGDVLEALLGLLGLLEEDPALLQAGPAQAPAEVFLQQLLGCVADVHVLRSHVRAALHIARFQDASSVEVVLLHGLRAAQVVLRSRALPVLLQGMLVAGNYVNSFSSLGGALGITLGSIAKFAQTRCKQGSQYANALVLVVQHLQGAHPDLAQRLTEDLDCCRSVQGLDARALEEMVEGLESQVEFVRSLARDAPSQGGPDALAPERLAEFLAVADPQVRRLARHLRDLQAATQDLRAWFAEPAETPLVAMLNNLAQLRDALPAAAKPQRAALSARPARGAHDAAGQPGGRAVASARGGGPWRPAAAGSLPGQPQEQHEEAAPAAGWRTAVTAPAPPPEAQEPQPQRPDPEPPASETSSEDTISTPGTDGVARFEEDLSALTSALEGLAPGARAASPEAAAAPVCDFEGALADLSSLLEGMAASRGAGDAQLEPDGFGGDLGDADFEEPLSELHSALKGMALSRAWSSVLPGGLGGEAAGRGGAPRLASEEDPFEAPLAELSAALARAGGGPAVPCRDEGAFAQPLADLEAVVARLAGQSAGDARPPADAASDGEESEALRDFRAPLGSLETALAVLGSRINAHG